MKTEQKRNYDKELQAIIENIRQNEIPPKLLLHSCCAPCSSYVLEYLSGYFSVTVFYFNPNIYPEEEFNKRINEQKRLIESMPLKNKVSFIGTEYQSERFYAAVKGLENAPEGGERCIQCFRLRLGETAKLACSLGFDYFTTTLSISPHKSAVRLNDISEELSKIYNADNLPSDFKKRGGYKRSAEISALYGIYRQDYCGCIFSLREKQKRLENL